MGDPLAVGGLISDGALLAPAAVRHEERLGTGVGGSHLIMVFGETMLVGDVQVCESDSRCCCVRRQDTAGLGLWERKDGSLCLVTRVELHVTICDGSS